MSAYLLPQDGTADVIVFDVIEQEMHESVSEVTTHPVEKGVDIADHIRPQPDHFSFTGFITNQPIYETSANRKVNGEQRQIDLASVPQYLIPPAPTFRFINQGLGQLGDAIVEAFGFGTPEKKAVVLAFAQEFDAVREMHERLEQLRINAVLVSVVTGIRVYNDLVIEKVSAPRAAGQDGVSFSLDMKQIRIVETSQVVAVPVPEEPRGANEKNNGGQGGKDAGKNKKKPASIAFQALKGLGAF